jgi:hypothetical protein
MVWGLLTRTLNCIFQHDPKFKSLGLFESLSKKRAGLKWAALSGAQFFRSNEYRHRSVQRPIVFAGSSGPSSVSPQSSPVDLGAGAMKVDDPTVTARPGFKMVCDECGGLSIRVADLVHAPTATLIQCGRCGTVRGTLSELHDLARRGTKSFDF